MKRKKRRQDGRKRGSEKSGEEQGGEKDTARKVFSIQNYLWFDVLSRRTVGRKKEEKQSEESGQQGLLTNCETKTAKNKQRCNP